jgi:hypothetical protein
MKNLIQAVVVNPESNAYAGSDWRIPSPDLPGSA